MKWGRKLFTCTGEDNCYFFMFPMGKLPELITRFLSEDGWGSLPKVLHLMGAGNLVNFQILPPPPPNKPLIISNS